jgi:dTDP-glucose 4,6-dehydratase
MRILITGAGGLVGSHLTKIALEHQHQVIAFDKFPNSKFNNRLYSILEHSNFTQISGDITNPNDTHELCVGIDVVVNLAGKTSNAKSIKTPKPYIDTNIQGTLNLLESARLHTPTKFIQGSTTDVYGINLQGNVNEESELYPATPYAASKAAAEKLAISYFNSYNIPVLITRPTKIYGPYQNPTEPISIWIQKAMEHKAFNIFGTYSYPILHVQDYCSAILKLIEDGCPGKIYNVANKDKFTPKDLANKIAEIINSKSTFTTLEDPKKPHTRYTFETENIESLGWLPKISTEAGLQTVVDFIKLNKWWWF